MHYWHGWWCMCLWSSSRSPRCVANLARTMRHICTRFRAGCLVSLCDGLIAIVILIFVFVLWWLDYDFVFVRCWLDYDNLIVDRNHIDDDDLTGVVHTPHKHDRYTDVQPFA